MLLQINMDQPNPHELHKIQSSKTSRIFGKKAKTTDTLKFAGSSIAHALIQLEVDKLKSKGIIFIYLHQPSQSQHGMVELIKWYMDLTSKTILSTFDLQKSYIVIVLQSQG